jgi:hypothetical protein
MNVDTDDRLKSSLTLFDDGINVYSFTRASNSFILVTFLRNLNANFITLSARDLEF